MSNLLAPYIFRAGDAEAMLTFYQQALGGDLTLARFADMPGDHGDEVQPDWIMHGELHTPDGWLLLASDGATPGGDTPGAVTLCVMGSDVDHGTAVFHKLSEGATITIAFEQQFWGATYGQLVDRFGVTWAVNVGQGNQQ
ncbi:VOC family protein [Corynebacterium choanae]|uniref:Glyoxalase/fosfomycin resistance/dioxygenase domain-containing protein n=1 Tax=Corynebacterium choanae TaxID=1862358 RepID=A0A3G6J3F2_9CORY|nr:VOC family protein [Corynebacterium choanae]AZA12601.1 hypothetical protein CCHOA_00860 [Corynebacterium choanae]